MIRRLSIICSMLIMGFWLFGQNRTIYGTVSDQISREKLIGASVLDLHSGRGAATDHQGVFTLSLPSDSISLIISYVGYSIDTVSLSEVPDYMLKVSLAPNASIDEVLVRYKTASRGPLKLSFEEITQIPSLGGEPDVFKSFQLMPGIQSGAEGSSTIHVRGGGPGGNLVLLDNVPMYYMNHLGGFVSIFNPDIINNVELYKDGFPAKYGGRLSSIMEITLKEGNSEKMSGECSIGILAAKASVGGPLKDGQITYLFSIRRTMIDLFTRLFFPIAVEDYTMGYHFQDLNGKITYRINDKHTLHATSYYGDDRLLFSYNDRDFDEKARLTNRWGNAYLSFDLKSVLSGKVQVNNQLIIARYRLKNEFYSMVTQPEPNDSYYYQLSGLKDYGFRSDWTFSPWYQWTIYTGFELTHHRFVPSATSAKETISFSEYITAKYFESSLYLDNRVKLVEHLILNAGIRLSSCTGLEDQKLFPEPRMKLTLKVGESTTLSMSASRMIQYLHHLESSGNIMNSEYWLPVADQLPPSEAWQYSIGVDQGLFASVISIKADLYYKSMEQLVEYREGEMNISDQMDWIRKLETGGTGEAWGVETLLTRKTGKVSGFLGYTYSRSLRQFSNINYGNPYPYDFDRPHDISVNLNYDLSEKISLHAVWVYKTGIPITIPIGLHETILDDLDLGNEGYLYSAKNEYRMKEYHRLDLGMNYRKQKKRVDVLWSFSIYNVYNRLNPYYYYLDYEENEYDGIRTTDEPFVLKQTAFFPFIPSISYRIEF